MKAFNSIEELKPYYNEETNTYVFNEDVEFNFDLIVDSNLDAHNIEALNIDVRYIKAHNIEASDIIAYNIDARNISYYAVCVAYRSFECESISGRRNNSIHTCLDDDVVISKPKQTVTLKLTEKQLDKIKKLLEE